MTSRMNPGGLSLLQITAGVVVATTHPEMIAVGVGNPQQQDIEPVMRALTKSQVVLELVTDTSGKEFRVL